MGLKNKKDIISIVPIEWPRGSLEINLSFSTMNRVISLLELEQKKESLVLPIEWSSRSIWNILSLSWLNQSCPDFTNLTLSWTHSIFECCLKITLIAFETYIFMNQFYMNYLLSWLIITPIAFVLPYLNGKPPITCIVVTAYTTRLYQAWHYFSFWLQSLLSILKLSNV